MGAVTLVNKNSGTEGFLADQASASLPLYSTGAGNLLIVTVAYVYALGAGVSWPDAASLTFTGITLTSPVPSASPYTSPSHTGIWVGYALNIPAGKTAITMKNTSGIGLSYGYSIVEFSGVAGFDGAGAAAGTSSKTTPAASCRTPNGLLYGCALSGSLPATGTGMSTLNNGVNFNSGTMWLSDAYAKPTTTAANNPGFTFSGTPSWWAGTATFHRVVPCNSCVEFWG